MVELANSMVDCSYTRMYLHTSAHMQMHTCTCMHTHTFHQCIRTHTRTHFINDVLIGVKLTQTIGITNYMLQRCSQTCSSVLKRLGHFEFQVTCLHTFKQLNGNLRQPFIVRLKAEQHAATMKVGLYVI